MCTNQRAEDVLTGEAVVMPSRTPVQYARRRSRMNAMALWTLQPLAWMAQGAAIWGMLGLSALAVAAPGRARAPAHSPSSPASDASHARPGPPCGGPDPVLD